MKKIILPFLILAGAFSRLLMTGLPNVEPIMLVTLASGIKYGAKYGFLTGFFTMLVSDALIYGTIPWFSAGLGLSLIALVSIATNFTYGAVGLFSGAMKKIKAPWTRQNMATAAAWLTIFYDLVTNVAWAFITHIPVAAALASGVPFMIIHVLSNMLIVGALGPTLLAALDRIPDAAQAWQRNVIPTPVQLQQKK